MYLNHLPPYLREMAHIKRNGEVVDAEISELDTAVQSLADNQFLHTANKYGVERWEKILNILPLDTDGLEDRRFRVYAKINTALPYTKSTILVLLENLCGHGNYLFNIDYRNKVIMVKINLVARAMFNEVASVLEAIVPLNMQLDIDLLYNSHEMISAFTHEYLGQYTHEEIREEVLK